MLGKHNLNHQEIKINQLHNAFPTQNFLNFNRTKTLGEKFEMRNINLLQVQHTQVNPALLQMKSFYTLAMNSYYFPQV